MTGDEFKAARIGLGLDQAQAARLLGYGSKTRISEVEAGRRAPGAAVVLLLRAYAAGYRPTDWPAPAPEPEPEAAAAVFQPVALPEVEASPEAVAAVERAMRNGARRPGEIARVTRLGLLTVEAAMKAIAARPRPAVVLAAPRTRRRR